MMSNASTTALSREISLHLDSKGLTPTAGWLDEFLSTQKPTHALAALKQTALFRLLASDFTTSIKQAPSTTYPTDVLNAQIKERHLRGPIPVQILDVEDIGHSLWSQIEAIEAAESGETTRGREVIRVVADEQGPMGSEPAATGGPHKLLVQDSKGAQIYAFEVTDIDGISTSMNIGAKLILRNATVRRGVLQLEPSSATFLGGKIESLHKIWRDTRKSRLKDSLGS